MSPKAQLPGPKLSVCLIGVCLLVVASSARADPLLPPVLPLIGPLVAGQLSIPLSAQGLNIDRLGTYRLDGLPGGISGTSGVVLGAFGEPEPLLIVTAGASPTVYVRGNATLIYEFAVLSPPDLGCSNPHFGIGGPDCSVPVVAEVSGRAHTHGGAILASDPDPGFIVRATWALQNAQGFDIFSDGISTGLLNDGAFSDEFDYEKSLSLTANRVYRVRMDVNAEAKASTLPASATAMIDPIFSFGPGVDPGYSFQFSAGIGNSRPNPVPEPGSLVLVGVAATGLVGRRVRRR